MTAKKSAPAPAPKAAAKPAPKAAAHKGAKAELEDKKKERRQKAMDALGINRGRQDREDAADRARRLAASRVESTRTETREKNKKVVRDSVFDEQRSTGFDDSLDPAPKKKS